jgi:antitoxin VapB
MNLNIKGKDARRLAHELAEATGETITAAVTRAIQERLERVATPTPTAEELLGIGRDCAKRLKEPWRSRSVDELLYDERGLPR